MEWIDGGLGRDVGDIAGIAAGIGPGLFTGLRVGVTTAIVMVSLARKLIPENKLRLMFSGLIVLAANAGGAWSPIGDVTTTMLWIGGQITASEIIRGVFLASVVNLVIPLFAAAWLGARAPERTDLTVVPPFAEVRQFLHHFHHPCFGE